MLLLVAAALLCGQSAVAQHTMPNGMGGVVQPSPNMTHPCYTTPSDPACASYRRSHADVMADRASLCAAMDFMVGCTLMHECQDGLADVNGTYCRPWSHVGALCMDMSRMKGCEAWNALCGANATGSVVEMCMDPPPVPGVLTTMDAKMQISSICAEMPGMSGCSMCDTAAQWDPNCDYLSTLATLCQEMPEMSQCSSFIKMCRGEGVADAFPELCAYM